MPFDVARPFRHLALVVAAAAAAGCADTPAGPEAPTQASAMVGVAPGVQPEYGGPMLYLPAVPQLTAGDSHTCALRRDWVAFCWGGGSHGQLGHARFESSATPVQVEGVLFKQIDAGGLHTCGLDRDGVAYCWGSSGWLQLGQTQGTVSDQSRPNRVANAPLFAQISAGGDHSCALTSGGEAYCWGTNYYGQTGDANLGGYSYTPARVSTNIVFKRISAGGTYTCGVATDDHAHCWGAGYMLGNGSSMHSGSPLPVKVGRVAALSAGSYEACVVTSYNSGDGMCWGSVLFNESDNGMFANGVNVSARFPVPTLAQGGLKWHQVRAGGGKLTCGLRRADGDAANDRTVWCWGLGSSGQIGNGTTALDNPLPRRTQLAEGGVRALEVGLAHACALTSGGTILCWGKNSAGQLGAGSAGGYSTTPRAIVGGGSFAP